ncbi:MAG TPA: nickel pincer cofactor biosynthesis protein LarC [Trebonia sp.]
MTDRPAAAYVDATAGVAGDMLLAALLDAGADVERVSGAIASLGVPGLGLRTEAARRGGLACLRAVIITPPAADRERHLADVLGHVGASDLRPAAKDLATRVFRLLAEAEGAVHGAPPQDVHFHEVGAFDSMAEVVGSAAALEDLGLLRPGAVVSCSALAAGSGFVNSQHGRLPVPAPAVLRIAATAGLDLAGGDLAGERTTPTGAALLAAAAAPGGFPAMTVHAVGTGGGGRDTPDRPNITRVVVGEASAEQDLREGDVTVVESTVDDLDPRLWPSVLQAVRAAGAWDCWCTPIVGRHGRPGQVLTALCAEQVRRAVAAAIFAHTGTLGVRWSRMNRLTASRTSVAVEVGPPGSGQVVTVKVADTTDGLAGFGTVTAELAEAEAAARALGWPVRAVCEAAVAQYRAQDLVTMAQPAPETGPSMSLSAPVDDQACHREHDALHDGSAACGLGGDVNGPPASPHRVRRSAYRQPVAVQALMPVRRSPRGPCGGRARPCAGRCAGSSRCRSAMVPGPSRRRGAR